MKSPYELLVERKWRAVLQLAMATIVVAAPVVAVVDNAAARAISVLLIGISALAGLKLSLVGLQRLRGVERSTVAQPAESTASSEEIEQLRAEVATLAALARRHEPAIAELATLRHEVTYLRETLSRIDRSAG